jgi:type VI secretion system protein ImpK
VVEQLLQSHRKNVLDRDLAAVFLLALQLGFKGALRGTEDASALQPLREQLYHLADSGSPEKSEQRAFPETYAHRQSCAKGERLAPLGPWYLTGKILLILYFFASTAVWVTAMHSFEQKFTGKVKAKPSAGIDRRQ